MKNVLILSVFYFANVFFCSAQFDIFEVKKSLKTMNLKGNVSKVTHTTRTIREKKDKSVDTSNWLKNIYLFDKNGNCIEVIEYLYKSTGKFDTIVTEKGFVTERSIKAIYDTVRTTHLIYRYDERNRPIETIKYGENYEFKHRHILSYTYDSEGRIVTAISDFDGADGSKLNQKYIFEYLKEGGFICETIDLENNHSYGTTTYNKYGVSVKYAFSRSIIKGADGSSFIEKVDERGNIIEESNEKGDTVFYVRSYKYDENGNKIERKDVNFYEKTNSTMKFIFDKNNNEIRQESYNYKNKPGQSFISEYDQNNNKTKTIFHEYGKWNKVDFIINYSYKFDSSGNWISKHEKSTSENSPESIENREIIYFE
jgi:hypothetical protein